MQTLADSNSSRLIEHTDKPNSYDILLPAPIPRPKPKMATFILNRDVPSQAIL